MCTWSGGRDATSWMDGVGECGMYWTDKSVDETKMWRVCQLLNSWRRLVANWASSLTRALSLWVDEAGELMDGFGLPDIVQWWKMQRGSRQKVAWVWLCWVGGCFLPLRCLGFFQGAGGSRSLLLVLRFHIGGGRFQ